MLSIGAAVHWRNCSEAISRDSFQSLPGLFKSFQRQSTVYTLSLTVTTSALQSQLAICLGIVLAFWINFALQAVDVGWRLSIWVQIVPSATLCVGAVFLPSSPHWLLKIGKSELARATFMRCQTDSKSSAADESAATNEFNQLLASTQKMETCSCRDAKNASRTNGGLGLCSKYNVALLGIGCSLQLLQQFCGMNAFMYYGPQIFRDIGIDPFLFTAIIGVINFAATIPAIFAQVCTNVYIVRCSLAEVYGAMTVGVGSVGALEAASTQFWRHGSELLRFNGSRCDGAEFIRI